MTTTFADSARRASPPPLPAPALSRGDGELAIGAVAVIAAVMFLAMIGRRDIVTSHEGRVVQTARQVAAVGWPWSAGANSVSVPVVELTETPNGKRLAPVPRAARMTVNPWLVPVINGQVRLQKPPLPYWCAAIVYRVFGYDPIRARIVPALLGAIATLLIADLARMVLGRRAALPAAIVWVSTHFIVDEFRKAMADPYLAFFTLLAVWAWVRSGRSGTILFWIALAIGALAKGPVIILTVVPAVVLAGLLLRRRRRGAPWWAHLLGIALFLAIALPWPIYVLRRVPNAMDLWRYESIGEFGDNDQKARPWWLYVVTSFQLALPWTPMWITGIALALLPARARRAKPAANAPPAIAARRARSWFMTFSSPRARRRWVVLGWFFIVLIVFSFANVKKNAYLLPVAAATTLTTADALALLVFNARREGFRGLGAILAAAQAAVGVGFGLGLAVMCWRQLAIDLAAGVTVSLVSAALAAIALWAIARSATRAWLWLTCAAYALALSAFIGIYMADRENNRSPKAFARALAQYVEQSGVPIDRNHLPEEASVYLPMNIRAATEASQRLIVLVDDNRREIELGKVRADAAFFAPMFDDEPIFSIDRLRLGADDGQGRWKAYLLTRSHGRADVSRGALRD